MWEASSVVGIKLNSVEAVTEKRIRRKLKAILSHSLYVELFAAFIFQLFFCILLTFKYLMNVYIGI